jgi:hypothetical protein
MRKIYFYLFIASFIATLIITSGKCYGRTYKGRRQDTVSDTAASRSLVDPLVKDISAREQTAERSRDNNASISGRELTSGKDPETSTQYGSMVADIFTMR